MVKIIGWIAAAVMALAMSGCDFKEPVNSDIEGFWKLERFETRADGRMHECTRLYYSITRYVVEVSEKQGPNGYGTYIGRFGYEDGETKVVMKDLSRGLLRATTALTLPWKTCCRSESILLRQPLMWWLPTATILYCALIMPLCSSRASDLS